MVRWSVFGGIFKAKIGIRYIQFWSCVTVARTWLFFLSVFLYMQHGQATKIVYMCSCAQKFLSDLLEFVLLSLPFFLASFCDHQHFHAMLRHVSFYWCDYVMLCQQIKKKKQFFFFTLFFYSLPLRFATPRQRQ